jgi:DNA-binding transcriptional regulator YbjK
MSQQEADREFLELCEEEKAQALNDLYGKQNEIKETPQLLESALAKLRDLLEQATDTLEDFHCLRAVERCPYHAQDPDFLLRFLRAEH